MRVNQFLHHGFEVAGHDEITFRVTQDVEDSFAIVLVQHIVVEPIPLEHTECHSSRVFDINLTEQGGAQEVRQSTYERHYMAELVDIESLNAGLEERLSDSNLLTFDIVRRQIETTSLISREIEPGD